jgi:hypothetical protein
MPFFATFLVIVSDCIGVRHILARTPCYFTAKFVGLNGTYLKSNDLPKYMMQVWQCTGDEKNEITGGRREGRSEKEE